MRKNKYLLTILLVALTVRIAYLMSIKPWSGSYANDVLNYGDASEYNTIAKILVEEHKYPDNIFLDVYRTPVFPLYISIFYFLFGIKPYLIIISHLVLNLIAIISIYLLCNKLFGNKTISLFASALYALEPNVIKLVSEFGTETLHATFLIVSFYIFIKGLKDKKFLYIGVSGIIFGITALTRPINLYYYIPLILYILFFPNEKIKMKIKYVLIFIAFYFLTISPWMFRNYSVYGYFSTNVFQGNAIMYNAGLTKSYETGLSTDITHKEFLDELTNICETNKIQNQFEIEKVKNKLGTDYILGHLGTYIKLHLKGMLLFFISPLNNSNYGLLSKIVVFIYLSIIYLFCSIGLYYLIKHINYYILIVLFSTIFYFCFLTGILGISRYRLPTTAFYLIIASYGLYYFSIYFKNKIKNKSV